MKIACVDKSAQNRLALQKNLELAFSECRRSIGHLSTVQFIPNTVDELLINRSADLVVLGSKMPFEDAYHIAKEIRTELPTLPIVLFLATDYYSLRTIKRFESYVTEIFPENESSVTIVHKISTLAESKQKEISGKLIVVQGVKGGVGATSIVSGLAHAAEANSLSCVVIDLSNSAALLHYVAAPKCHSADHATLLTEKIVPDITTVEKLITTAPNGMKLLLPPSGGGEMREMLLRDPDRFEISITMIDILRSIYDIVLVDCANAEGVLTYALFAHAHCRVLITSNDPASVHLLNNKLSEVMQTPGDGATHILPNMLVERGLTKDDIIDFLLLNDYFDEAMSALETIGPDSRATNWIGTGNSFYTEASHATQLIFERNLRTCLLTEKELATRQKLTKGLFGTAKQISTIFGKTKTARLGIPLLGQKQSTETNNKLKPISPTDRNISSASAKSKKAAPGDTGEFILEKQFTPPQLVNDARKVSNKQI